MAQGKQLPLLNTMMHELGHGLGLPHELNPESLVSFEAAENQILTRLPVYSPSCKNLTAASIPRPLPPISGGRRVKKPLSPL